jgi:hypothetical protein
MGKWIKYPLSYNTNGKGFYIDVQQGTDLSERISGGVDKELRIVRENT